MAGVAINRLKLSVEAFYELAPIEYYHALRDYHELKIIDIQTNYEIARWSIMHQWNMAGRYLKKTLKKPMEVMPFPWETETAPRVQSQEEMKQQMLNIAKMFGTIKKK